MTLYMPLFRSCSTLRSLTQLHAHIVVTGLHHDPLPSTKLLDSYAQMGSLHSSRLIFYAHPSPDSFMFAVLVKSYLTHHLFHQVLSLYNHHIQKGSHLTQNCTFLYPSLLKAVSCVGDLVTGAKLHGRIVASGLTTDHVIATSLLGMYGDLGCLSGARKVFDEMRVRDLVSWSSVISCYIENGWPMAGLEMLRWMVSEGIGPDSVTMVSVAEACGKVGCLRLAKSVHGYVIRKEMDGYASLRNCLIVMYSQCGYLSGAKGVFESLADRSTACWTSMISSCNQNGCFEEAIHVFRQMQESEVEVNGVTMISVLCCCASAGAGSIQFGQQIHGHVMKRGFGDEFVQNSLMDMYSKCGFVDLAYTIFDKIREKSIVTWNCMICGFSQNGISVEALRLFDEMYFNCLDINEVTFLSAIQACSNSGYLEKGKWIHHKLIVSGVQKDLYIDTALVDMYAKCGDLKTAEGIFDSMPEKSVVSWSSMIAAYGIHGQITAATTLFTKMVESDIKPNEVTFMNILSACRHAGSVEEGKFYFNSMRDYGVVPNAEHFASIIDLLSRAGDINGAYEIIKSTCLPIDASIWGALLNGCRIHGRMDLIKGIQKELREIRTDDTGYYTLLSNIYAEGGNWYESKNVRSRMEGMGLKKVPGYSSIEIDKKTYRFGAGDTSSECQMKEIYTFLENFQSLAQEQGCDVECYGKMYGTSMYFEDYNVYKLQRETSNGIWSKSDPF
uniref:Uncharacterized protein n=1 Tax=Cajanus cajan TaxID=3821 RepID=A0A151TFE9_CAJCA|nr:hypothetical protein KK1_012051 [Cajanus cajan]